MKNRGPGFNMPLTAFAVLVLISALITPPVFAEDRVAEGAKDIAQGSTAIPREIAQASNESNIVAGVVVGTAKGLMNTVKGVTEGVGKILTFYDNSSK